MTTSLTASTRRRWGVGAVGACLVWALGACTGGDSQVPSVGGSTLSGDGATDLEAVARNFHDCLTDAGLPATYEPGPDGRSTLVRFDDQRAVIWISANSAGVTAAVPDDQANAILSDAYPDQALDSNGVMTFVEPEPFLQVDGVDQTEAWTTCLASSGYEESKVWQSIDKGPELEVISQLTVEASNLWARCARDNGYPSVIDAHMPQTENQYPTALLPPSITAEQLEQLLTACPAFDPAVEEANNALLGENYNYADWPPAGYQVQPSIGFDFPGHNGEYSATTDALTPEQQATAERLGQLYEIIYQAQMEYYPSLAGDNGINITPENGQGGSVVYYWGQSGV
ncbi:MAG: hypothetical protein LBK42_04900 [Propionibacteriaceae bacterium]|jgi:hypothetical protein|nr:hypothetical protein [Propionibacteriaceae bacterium]